jgi:phage terminase large subunit
MQGLVYKEFDMERHTYSGKHKKEVRETIAGVDFGYTNPMAALKIEVDSDAHYYISDEYYEKQRTTAQLIGYIKPWNPRIVYPDPAEPDRIQELGQAGLNCYDVSKDVEAGIDKVRELFKAGRIHISRDCANLIWELQNYSYPEKRADRNEYEAPIKENDHALDALRYALYMHSPSQAPENPFVIQRRRELVVRNDAH